MGTSVEMIDRTYGHLRPTPRSTNAASWTLTMLAAGRRWNSVVRWLLGLSEQLKSDEREPKQPGQGGGPR